ncbi:motile sperm domain-containing protein 2 isoform X2 [Dromiciops gliroides]|uniref:motile sperm domain-containing protein 2 isoform X2 n=1 Tax=Dromiciops gliroides TaxID=33562 RepID=UPI001CC3F3E4|nr:motile sperm domain-containing protein 2 isoform X2 [Dromiciops gliroides]
MAQAPSQEKSKLVSETRRRFEAEYLADKSDKYDTRDVEKLQQDDNWVESFLCWRHDVVDDTLKMIDESFQWRKEFGVNDLSESTLPKWLFEVGAVYLHGYDKEGNKLFWFRVKFHTKDNKTILDKKKLVAFWLERYAKRENGKPLTVMFDMSETGLSNIDMDIVRFIINCFKVYYPKYLTKIVVFDMPWIMNAAFKIVKGWLGPEAVNMLKFTGKNEVQEYVSIEYLPPHMGGTDPFKYSYPPLVDDDFQTPLCENGPITSEDETESKEDIETDNKETGETNSSEEQAVVPKKISPVEQTSKAEESDKVDSKIKTLKKSLSMFKGVLLHISPAEELYFGSKEIGEKKCLIILTNVTKNVVAFKVRTTAPDKYRVKPSNSCCDPGSSLDVVVSLHGGFTISPQDRFLIMAAEMEQSCGTGAAELAQFWKDIPRNKIMEHSSEDIHLQLTRLLDINRKLQDEVDRCLWFQQLLFYLTVLLLAFATSCFYLLYSQRSNTL